MTDQKPNGGIGDRTLFAAQSGQRVARLLRGDIAILAASVRRIPVMDNRVRAVSKRLLGAGEVELGTRASGARRERVLIVAKRALEVRGREPFAAAPRCGPAYLLIAGTSRKRGGSGACFERSDFPLESLEFDLLLLELLRVLIDLRLMASGKLRRQ